jgi:hypothetical protein
MYFLLSHLDNKIPTELLLMIFIYHCIQVIKYLISFFVIYTIVGLTKAGLSHHYQSTPYYSIVEKNFHAVDPIARPLLIPKIERNSAVPVSADVSNINHFEPELRQSQPIYARDLMPLTLQQSTNRLQTFQHDLPPGYVSLAAMIDVPPGYQLFSNKLRYY